MRNSCKFLTWRAGAIILSMCLTGGLVHATDAEVAGARIKKDLTYLASDECEGRGVTTSGIQLAASYISRQFKEAGLAPGGIGGTYFQPFKMRGTVKLGSPNSITLHGSLGQTVALTPDKQFRVTGMSANGSVSAPLVFVGYGVTEEKSGYDDYKGVDAAGKIVIMLRKTPRANDKYKPFGGQFSTYLASLAAKIANADEHKVAGILLVNDRDSAAAADSLMEFSYTSMVDVMAKVPVFQIRRGVADSILQSSLGKSLREIEQDIDAELTPRSAALAGWSADLKATIDRSTIEARNIIGVLEGKGPLAKEYVVLGAHYDHLGFGGMGSLARGLTTPTIHHGADDNASGTTLMIEVARRFGHMPDRQGRTLIFMAFSGEESGLIGSQYYCKHPLFPLAETAAMVNIDMVGRLRQDADAKKDRLVIYGTGTSPSFAPFLKSVAERLSFKFHEVATGMGPSDQESFYLKKIPVLFFFTDTHKDYHRPTDTADKINYEGMVKIGELVEATLEHLATVTPRPAYFEVPSAPTASRSRSGVPSIGIRPSYGDEGPGVLLDGVTAGRPAAKAGLKEGDRIVAILGKPCKDMEMYMTLMGGVKPGDTVEFTILREGKKIPIKIATEK